MERPPPRLPQMLFILRPLLVPLLLLPLRVVCEPKPDAAEPDFSCGLYPEAWSCDKMRYCCKHESKGCPLVTAYCGAFEKVPDADLRRFSCMEGQPENWHSDKQVWCCDNYNKCVFTCCKEFLCTWEQDERDWCCKYRDLDCDPDPGCIDGWAWSYNHGWCCKEDPDCYWPWWILPLWLLLLLLLLLLCIYCVWVIFSCLMIEPPPPPPKFSPLAVNPPEVFSGEGVLIEPVILLPAPDPTPGPLPDPRPPTPDPLPPTPDPEPWQPVAPEPDPPRPDPEVRPLNPVLFRGPQFPPGTELF